jgi:hypothetical protein
MDVGKLGQFSPDCGHGPGNVVVITLMVTHDVDDIRELGRTVAKKVNKSKPFSRFFLEGVNCANIASENQ